MDINDLCLLIATSQIGIKEDTDESRILDYFHDIGHKWVKSDDTAWCSAFVNWVCFQADVERSNKLNARSWLEVGQDVSLRRAREGDIVVFWRESETSWKGHVGFYIGDNGRDIYVLGGNQNNRVCIKKYPKDRLLSVRRLEW